MATLKIQLKDKKFVSHNNVNVVFFSENYIEGNGWECSITGDGNFYCIATRFYGGERHQIKLNVKNGYVKLLLKIGDGRPRVLKAYKLEKWPNDGTIGLPSGFIDNRRAYFREIEFQKLLDEYGITSVRHISPNGVYPLIQKTLEDGEIFEEEMETDGNLKVTSNDEVCFEEDYSDADEHYYQAEVTDATWAIKKVSKSGKITHRILYTLDDPRYMDNLPKIK